MLREEHRAIINEDLGSRFNVHNRKYSYTMFPIHKSRKSATITLRFAIARMVDEPRRVACTRTIQGKRFVETKDIASSEVVSHFAAAVKCHFVDKLPDVFHY